MKVLVIGGNDREAQTLWPGCEVETMDANPEKGATYTHDAQTMPDGLAERFDKVLASHVLEHIPYWETVQVLKEWGKVLKTGGELHVIVPSLEWVAEQLLEEQPSIAILPHLHGGLTSPWDVHLGMFTMRRLRSVMEQAGFGVFLARTGPYHIMAMGKEEIAEQHYVCGMKKEAVNDNAG